MIYSLIMNCVVGKIRDNIMKLIMMVVAICHLGATLVPPDTYVTTEGRKVMKILRKQGQSRKILQVSRVLHIPISRLKPYPCDNIEYTAHSLMDFGPVGTIDKTFTEVFTTDGRYYKAPREYDLYCACPPLYGVEWDPALGTQKIYSPQERDSYDTNYLTVDRFLKFMYTPI